MKLEDTVSATPNKRYLGFAVLESLEIEIGNYPDAVIQFDVSDYLIQQLL